MSEASAPVRAVAHVATARAERYAKQLASHLGRHSEVRESADGTLIVLAAGSCLLTPREDELTLSADAPTEADLDVVTDVVGRHLVRFGDRDELVVDWHTP